MKQMRAELDGLHETVEVLLACIGKDMYAEHDCCCDESGCCVTEEE